MTLMPGHFLTDEFWENGSQNNSRMDEQPDPSISASHRKLDTRKSKKNRWKKMEKDGKKGISINPCSKMRKSLADPPREASEPRRLRGSYYLGNFPTQKTFSARNVKLILCASDVWDFKREREPREKLLHTRLGFVKATTPVSGVPFTILYRHEWQNNKTWDFEKQNNKICTCGLELYCSARHAMAKQQNLGFR